MNRVMWPISTVLIVLGVGMVIFCGFRTNVVGSVAGLLMLVTGLHERNDLRIGDLRRRIAALETCGVHLEEKRD